MFTINNKILIYILPVLIFVSLNLFKKEHVDVILEKDKLKFREDLNNYISNKYNIYANKMGEIGDYQDRVALKFTINTNEYAIYKYTCIGTNIIKKIYLPIAVNYSLPTMTFNNDKKYLFKPEDILWQSYSTASKKIEFYAEPRKDIPYINGDNFYDRYTPWEILSEFIKTLLSDSLDKCFYVESDSLQKILNESIDYSKSKFHHLQKVGAEEDSINYIYNIDNNTQNMELEYIECSIIYKIVPNVSSIKTLKLEYLFYQCVMTFFIFLIFLLKLKTP